MSLTSRTNRWASKVIIILQLVTWNAVGILLLHRGVSTLRRRILETSNVVEAADPPFGLESIVSTTRRDGSEYNLATRSQLSIDKNVEIIQIDPERSFPRDNRNLSGLSERLKNAFEIVSEEQRSTLFPTDSLVVPTIIQATPASSRLKNHLTENRRHTGDNHFEDKDVTSKISRIARDREHNLAGKGIGSGSSHVKENVTLISDRSGSRTTGSAVSTEEDVDLARNSGLSERLKTAFEILSKQQPTLFPDEDGVFLAVPTTIQTTSASSPSIHADKKTDPQEQQDQFGVSTWTGKSNMRASRANEDGATTAVALVSIGAIMLLVGPIVIILRVLDERRQARKLIALPTSAREDLPPTYEQAVLMDEAPRYSTLTLNDDHTPPPSPTHSSTYAYSNVAT